MSRPAQVDASAPAPDDDDTGLLDRMRAGDEVAFATLYRDLHPRLRRYAFSLVGQDADDVTAEAWLQIARDARGFVGDLDAFRGWAARIVRNRALDLVRYRARRPADSVAMEDLLDLAGADRTSDETVDGVLERAGTDRAVELIAGLPREQAEAVLLRAVVGLDAATAGTVLGKSATAVRVSAHRGLRRLEKLLADRGET